MSTLSAEWGEAKVLRAVFDQLSDALVLYNPDFIITGVNRAAERLFGMSSEEMVGKHCQEIFHCDVCEAGCGLLVGINQAPSAPHCTVRLRTNNGMERLVVMRTNQISNGNGVEGVVATIKDITEEAPGQKGEIIAESPNMREVLNFVRRVAASEATTVLLEGENGTGKDLIAKMLHYQSLRQAEPFIAINCAAIPDTLLESELFGYEKGAFTDARQQKRGIFELADKGTLFLDEIGEIPLMLQAKLLRVLEEQSFRRLGGLKDIRLDLRVVAATNKNLREAVKEGAFRQDLYFRLNVIHIAIPALRDRPEDIPLLVSYFIDHYNNKFKRRVEGVTPEAERLLLAHSWPGNVRELRNAIERAAVMAESDLMGPRDFGIASIETGAPSAEQSSPAPVSPDSGLTEALEVVERRMILEALERSGGVKSKAAEELKIPRTNLLYRMKRLGIAGSDDNHG